MLRFILDQAVATASLLSGVTCRYSRGTASVEIEGVLLGKASDLADTLDEDFPRLEHSDRDFLIRPAAIAFVTEPEEGEEPTDPVPVQPRPGDRIEILDVGHPACGKIYEVLALPGGRPYRSCDPHETLIRVFTRQI